jgi:hypothetical protein
MGRPRTSRFGAAPPKAHGTAGHDSGDGRLDPVRWHRPARGTLARLAAVAALLVTAAVVSWSPARSCADPRAGVAADPPPASSAAATPPRGSPASSGLPPPGPAQAQPGPVAQAVPSGSVGVPIRLADPAALSLVRPGNRVDLLRIGKDGASNSPVATSALVLEVSGADDPTAGGLLLALTRAEADHAVAASDHGFAILIRPG